MKRLTLLLAVMICVIGGMMFTGCGAPKEKGADAPGAAKKSEKAASNLLVSVKTVANQRFEHFIQVNGTVEAINEAFISPEINGQIKKIHVKEGRRVKKGDLLVSLSSDVIESSIAEVKSNLELARTVYKKRKGLWDKKIGSEIQYLEAKTNKDSLENRLKSLQAQLDMAKIKAPISGIIDDILRKEGELAAPGFQIIRLVNLKQVYVNAEVSESYLASIEKENPVWVTFPSYPSFRLETTVHRTGNVVKPENRTFLVQLKLDNKDEKLKPNMIAVLKMRDYVNPEAMVVPSIVIKDDFKGRYLYIVKKEKGKDIARKTYVETGRSYMGNTLVTQGLTPGRMVITEGYNLVKNGMEVQVKTKR